MPITKTFLKKTRTEAVVKLVGTGTATIALSELLLADETFDAAAVSVDIRKVTASTQPTMLTKVQRSTGTPTAPAFVDVLQIYGVVDWTFEGVKENEQTGKDLSVTTAGDGTVILTLRKNAGFIEPGRSAYLTGGA